MNHIHRLQRERDEALAELRGREEALHAFRAHLHTPKFQGFDSDGTRRDWIAVNDVLNWLRFIESAPRTARETPAWRGESTR